MSERAFFLEVADRWWLVIIRGVAAIIFGVLTLVYPVMSLMVLVTLFGAWCLIDGVSEIVMAYRHARTGTPWGWLLFEGIVSMAAAAFALLWPDITAVALLIVIAARAVLAGIAQIVMAVRLRKHIRHEWLLGVSGIVSIAFGVLLVLFPGPGALALLWYIGGFAIVFGALLIALGLRLERWRRSTQRTVPPEAIPTQA
ncbi:MAG TPA: HdeD family acid-resistance protein [Polyangiaceae bacterium]|jgi:uncharacterized membrane protein HdeD (DUF308 family)|nr:HdeD family acid-resistance protein [Polyangiaceae bacterium]